VHRTEVTESAACGWEAGGTDQGGAGIEHGPDGGQYGVVVGRRPHHEPVDGGASPSSDTASHAYVYRAMPSVGGVVHTHSPYATAWAALGEPIPCALTGIADEFGGDIPVGPFALIGSDAIGKGIVETLTGSRSPAVLMRAHGVFTVGGSARAAVKAAVLTEDSARTMHLARALGDVPAIAPDDVDALWARYQNVYGQR